MAWPPLGPMPDPKITLGAVHLSPTHCHRPKAGCHQVPPGRFMAPSLSPHTHTPWPSHSGQSEQLLHEGLQRLPSTGHRPACLPSLTPAVCAWTQPSGSTCISLRTHTDLAAPSSYCSSCPEHTFPAQTLPSIWLPSDMSLARRLFLQGAFPFPKLSSMSPGECTPPPPHPVLPLPECFYHCATSARHKLWDGRNLCLPTIISAGTLFIFPTP